MLDKAVATADEAVADIPDGASILVPGFADIGTPFELLDALLRRGTMDLTVISNNCGLGERGVAALFKHHRVRKVYATFAQKQGQHHFHAALEAGEVEVVLVPQGTLAERIRAAAAGLGGFYTPAGVGTEVAEGKEVREINGRMYLFEEPLGADVALVKAHTGDRAGNLRYRFASRNFNHIMAMAGKLTIAQVDNLVPVGAIGPDDVHTSAIFVDRVVAVEGGDR